MKTNSTRIASKLLSLILAVFMIIGVMPTITFADTSGYAYISASEDANFISDQNGDPLAYRAIPLEALSSINLEDYNLGDFKYDKNKDGVYEVTLLHLYIYVHTQIFGLNWDDVTVTGDLGSIYFAGGLFGFEDENLRYNYNGAYPADENGRGYTADQLVLSNGDFIEVAHFSDWSFWTDSSAGFHYFTNENDEINISYSAETGKALSVKLIRVGGGLGGGSDENPQPRYTVYYGTEIGNAIASVTTDDNGIANITFSDPGTYYIWCEGGIGDWGTIVSAPGCAIVTVTGESTGAGSESGSGDGSDDVGDPAPETDGVTSLKVTADDGVTLTSKATFYCCEDCEGEVINIATSKVTEIDTSVSWTCSTHNSTSTYYYLISINAFNAEDYLITGITVNGTKYAVDMTDDDYPTEYLDDYSYIGENNNCISIALAGETEIADQVIHVHAEKVEEEIETPETREPQDVSAILDATMAKLASTVTAPAFGTSAGEWTVFSLARGGYFAKDNAYFTEYYDRIVETINETAASVNMNGALHKKKSTENSRLIVALSSIGKNATSVGDWNLVEAYSLNDFDNWLEYQGLNGTIWALIALDSNNYVTSDPTIRQQCVDSILAAQHNDGGWSLMANKDYASDPDVTGMALTALYPYRDQEAVAAAVSKAITCLSEMQHDNGTFASGGSECSESCAWVIVACTTWGINPDTDNRFIKNGKSVVDGLLSHYLEEDAQFQHVVGAGANAMATDQSCYALVAYNRFLNNQPALFDYSDVTFDAVTPDDGNTDGDGTTGDGTTGDGNGDGTTGDGTTDDGDGDDTSTLDNITAVFNPPDQVSGLSGTTFDVPVYIVGWNNESGYKLIDMIVSVPEGITVAEVTTSSGLTGGKLEYSFEKETGKLRVVYFDSNNNNDLTITSDSFESMNELFNIKFKVEDVKSSAVNIAITGMSVKFNSDSTADDSMIVVITDKANGNVSIVYGVSFSAVCLYTGDDVDLIPKTKKAVAISVTDITAGDKIVYSDGTNEIEFKYSEEITSKTGIASYVSLVDASISMENFVNIDNYDIKINEDASNILFGDINADGVINAQDALAAVDFWLRKGDAPTDDQILAVNINSDSRINTFDALGIVEHFVNNSEYGVITKAATLNSDNQ